MIQMLVFKRPKKFDFFTQAAFFKPCHPHRELFKRLAMMRKQILDKILGGARIFAGPMVLSTASNTIFLSSVVTPHDIEVNK
jgi:hypothetical protein